MEYILLSCDRCLKKGTTFDCSNQCVIYLNNTIDMNLKIIGGVSQMQHILNKHERKMIMGKAFWIKIAIRLFVKWLEKRETEGTSNIVINEVLKAESIGDLKKIANSDLTEEAIESIVTECAEEPVGNILGAVFGGK